MGATHASPWRIEVRTFAKPRIDILEENMPYLEHDGVTRELPRGDTLVGSASDVDWRLQTINLAPRHFTVHVDDAGIAVLAPLRAQDVDVNGTTLTTARALQHNDEIIAGAGIFTFLETLDGTAPATSPTAASAYLIDIRGGLAYALTNEPATIGRDPVNQIAIRDPSVSRFHAEVRPTADGLGFAVRSMGAGGSSINGVLVGSSPRVMAEGDLVRIAGTTLRFTLQPPPPILRIVTKADGAAGQRMRPSGAIQAGAEAPTLGSYNPGARPGGTVPQRSTTWITGALVATGALLAVLILRALHSH
jgi:hypothetical protein